MYQKLNPKARSLMMAGSVFGAVLLTLLFTGIYLAIHLSTGKISVFWLVLLLAVIWIVSLVSPFVRYEYYRYRFTEEEIDVREGFLTITRKVVPIERLHKVSMVSGPFDRAFGFSKVIVTTAGGDVVIRFLETTVAEQIVEKLKKRINAYAIEDRKRG